MRQNGCRHNVYIQNGSRQNCCGHDVYKQNGVDTISIGKMVVDTMFIDEMA
jgi:hypothetical protein